jgi:hypothetical protein
MDEPTANGYCDTRTVGSRSEDDRWVIVAVLDPALPTRQVPGLTCDVVR